jgi:hypothetical protein
MSFPNQTINYDMGDQKIMSYEISLCRAWDELERLAPASEYTIDFLADRYDVRIDKRSVLLKCSGVAADEVAAVLILHYLIGDLKVGFHSRSEWISFRELRGGAVFWPAFLEGTIEPLKAYLERDPDGLVKNLETQFAVKHIQGGDVGFEVALFPGIFVRMIFWKSDDDLPCDATMLFDKGLAEIYSTEDIAVLLNQVVEKITK